MKGIKLSFNSQFSDRDKAEKILLMSVPYFARNMMICAPVIMVMEMFFILRIILGFSTGGYEKHIRYGACYIFLFSLSAILFVCLLVWKKNLEKHAKKVYISQIFFNVGSVAWAIAITLLDGYYLKRYDATLFMAVLLLIPVITFENPVILGCIHLIANAIVLWTVFQSGDIALTMNLFAYTVGSFIAVLVLTNTKKKLFIKQYELSEIEIRHLNSELEKRNMALLELTANQNEKIKQVSALNAELEAAKVTLLQTIEDQKINLNVVGSLSQAYICIYFIDLNNGKYIEINPTENEYIRKIIGESGNATEKFRLVIDTIIPPEQRDEFIAFTDFSTLPKRLADCNMVDFQFEGLGGIGWCVGEFIASGRDEDDNCTHVLWAVRSVQEQHDEEEAQKEKLRLAVRSAEQANEAKTIFLNNMSHDIRTPMNAILGFTKLMEAEKGNEKKIGDYLGKIEKSGEYLLTIINNVLEMARIESGKERVDENLIDLHGMEDTFAPLLENELKEKNLSLTFTKHIEHYYISTDAAKIEEICMNLLSNAVKYTPEGGRIRVELTESPCKKKGYGTFTISVSDTGIGMSREFLDVIFDSFTRERNTTESKIIGTGLGMSIVKKLVDLLGGSIEVESELGKGSTFTVTADCRIAQKPEIYINKKHFIQKTSDLKGKRILLAEDNDINAEIATAILERQGVVVDRARDGVICVDMMEKADSHYYDLILMDIQMPNLNGYLATVKIRRLQEKEKAGIPILAMTANAFEEDKQKAYEAGMNGHVSKPLDVQKLLEALTETLK